MWRFRRQIFLAMILFTGCWSYLTTASGQTLHASLKHYSTDDGLSSNAITKIKQDDYGFIWIATWNGLTRFDGYNFYNYETGAVSHIPNLHNRIADFSIDKMQNIWLNMYDNRLFVLKRNEDRIINPFEGVNGNENFRISRPVTVVSNGDVLAIVDGIGIFKLRLNNDGIKTELVTTGDLVVSAMVEGYQNDVWLATNQGVHRMDADNLTVERKGYFLDETITALYSNGFNIYAGTESGKILSFAYGQDAYQIRAGGDAVNAVFVDSHGLIWFSDNRNGVGYISPETLKEHFFTHDVRFPDYDGFGGEFCETNGIVWTRMNHGGFGYYDREEDQLRYFYNSPSDPWTLSNTVNAWLILKEGIVWESTSLHGLEKLEIMKNIIERHLLLEDTSSTLLNEVRALYYDKFRHALFMGNKNGSLFLINEDDGSRREFTHDSQGQRLGRVYGMSGDKDGNIWLSSKDCGLFKMTYTGVDYIIRNYQHSDNDPQSLNDNRVYQVQEDLDGNLWVATYGGGVNLMLKGTEHFIHPEDMIGYPRVLYHKVRSITMDRDGVIWAGTTDGILLLKYENGQATANKLESSYEQPDMILRSNDIVCMNCDSLGTIWLGTNSGGLAHVVGKDGQGRYLFENFGIKEGLPSDEVRSITIDHQGTVWFATDFIICSYNPGKRIISTYSSLEGVDQTLCSETSAITLPDGRIIFGTLNGYYVIDQTKLMTQNGSMLKLHLTDFWVDGVLQSPRYNSQFNQYIPETRRVEFESRPSEFVFRFASLDYRLQHRVHYQYMLEGYDNEWHTADKSRTAIYRNIPGGTYKLIIQAFVQESPDMKDQLEIEILLPPSFLHSNWSIWILIFIAIVVGIYLLFLRQNYMKRRMGMRKKQDDGENEYTFRQQKNNYEIEN